jgi:hypothetical protein
MIYQGTVQNGLVVIENGVQLPEGSPVRVEIKTQVELETDSEIDPIFQMGDLAVDLGVPDLATNIDHYLYGHPKVVDGQ